MRSKPRALSACLLAGCLITFVAACDRDAGPSPAPATPSTTAAPAVSSTAAAPVAAAPAPLLWFEPAAVRVCDKDPVKVLVHWNARSVQGIKSVEVRALGPGGKEVLFVHGGPLGQRETGEWMTAGRQMLLRDHADGRELGRAKLEALPCEQVAQPGVGATANGA